MLSEEFYSLWLLSPLSPFVRLVREAFLEFYPEKAVKDLEPASFFEKYKTNRISLQQAKDYETVLVKRFVGWVGGRAIVAHAMAVEFREINVFFDLTNSHS